MPGKVSNAICFPDFIASSTASCIYISPLLYNGPAARYGRPFCFIHRIRPLIPAFQESHQKADIHLMQTSISNLRKRKLNSEKNALDLVCTQVKKLPDQLDLVAGKVTLSVHFTIKSGFIDPYSLCCVLCRATVSRQRRLEQIYLEQSLHPLSEIRTCVSVCLRFHCILCVPVSQYFFVSFSFQIAKMYCKFASRNL